MIISKPSPLLSLNVRTITKTLLVECPRLPNIQTYHRTTAQIPQGSTGLMPAQPAGKFYYAWLWQVSQCVRALERARTAVHTAVTPWGWSYCYPYFSFNKLLQLPKEGNLSTQRTPNTPTFLAPPQVPPICHTPGQPETQQQTCQGILLQVGVVYLPLGKLVVFWIEYMNH